ncbi:Tryptophan--tRNA ligase, mitochondrial [Entomophthora muscae]|uniref:Tryptophan--tRNA ligase, mitochondrial n=1 Tax=Entomophthora muscae TaxID=34485 RepID=A0ACC2TBG7_9FUNG|nr:Tryptophan--tRNA ligase, mitochondrial [Entomophthora muscae]
MVLFNLASKDVLQYALQATKKKANPSRQLFKESIPQFSDASTIFSAIKPSGVPHLGHYFGVLKKWIELQKIAETYPKSKIFYMIADLHAIAEPF